jgi:hypothetical protein
MYYADLGLVREYFDDIKAWDEWPVRVDRLGKYGLRNEQKAIPFGGCIGCTLQTEGFQ